MKYLFVFYDHKDIYTHFFERKKKKDAKSLQDVQQSMQSSS